MTQDSLFKLDVVPGDPELLNLKTVRVLSQISMVLAAVSPKNYS